MKKLEKRKKQLTKQILGLRDELQTIEDRETQEIHNPRLLGLVGTCWVYKSNSYGSDTGKWDVYKKVREAFIEDGSVFFITEEFSVDCYGKCTWEIERHFTYPTRDRPFNDGYSQITSEEYEKARISFFQEASTAVQAKRPRS